MITLQQGNCLELMRKLEDNSIDLIFCDPPYNLSSEIIIRPDGRPDLKKAKDFMSKWLGLDAEFLEEWYKEAFRVLKYGGHCAMFGIDRQTFLFQYYAVLNGFTFKQSLYWYFVQNFPKSSDLSKMIDKRFGLERVVVGKKSGERYKYEFNSDFNNEQEKSRLGSGDASTITAPNHPLAQKYNGLKYSVAPLKQTCEEIMVFQKPYKHGSCLNDVLAYENGDESITVGALDIEGNRVELGDERQPTGSGKPSKQFDKSAIQPGRNGGNGGNTTSTNGRYPAQTFIGGFDLTIMVLDDNIDTYKKQEIIDFYGTSYLHTMWEAISNTTLKNQRWEGQILPERMLLRVAENQLQGGESPKLWQESVREDDTETKRNLEEKRGEHNDGELQVVEGGQIQNKRLYSNRLQTLQQRGAENIITNDYEQEQKCTDGTQGGYGDTLKKTLDERRIGASLEWGKNRQQDRELTLDGEGRTHKISLGGEGNNKTTETRNRETEKTNIYVRKEDIPEQFVKYFKEYKTFNISTAEVIDRQSGVLTSGKAIIGSGSKNNKHNILTGLTSQVNSCYADSGGASRILHTCNYEEKDFDLFKYCPKVSKSERSLGIDGYILKSGVAQNIINEIKTKIIT